MPPVFAALRVTMPASGLRYPPLVLAVRHALLNRGVAIVPKGNVPTVVLVGETMTPIIASINNNGGASTYLLDYSATFSVQAPDGAVLIAPTIIRVQREYSFDALNVLAMAREQAYLERRMRAAAARQIIWRLISFKGPPPKAAAPKAVAPKPVVPKAAAPKSAPRAS